MKSSRLGLSEKVVDCFKNQSNGLIVTLPGLGTSFYLSKIAKENGFNLVVETGQGLEEFNLIDINFNNQEDFCREIDRLFKLKYRLNKSPVMVVVVNHPSWLNSEVFRQSFFLKHVYNTIYFEPLSIKEIEDFFEVTDSRYFELSGGVGRIVKFLKSHSDILDNTVEEIASNEVLNKLLDPLIDEWGRMSQVEREKFNLRSPIIDWLFKKRGLTKPKIDLRVEDDLSFVEIGERSKLRMTLSESKIIKYLLGNEVISREKIGEIKWKNKSFEKYSDQAITTAISRINQKLTKYQLVPISGLGYRLEVIVR